MKHISKIIFFLVIVSFLAAPVAALNTTDNTPQTEKPEKNCCSMCKQEIKADATQYKVEYKGKTYYFCCEKCQAEFQKDPEKYVKCCDEAKKCCEGKVTYVCPMKQCNVTSDKPGKCPKCGMELKKVTEPLPCCSEKHEQGEEHQHHQDQHHHNHN